jgi:hypothetical protein
MNSNMKADFVAHVRFLRKTYVQFFRVLTLNRPFVYKCRHGGFNVIFDTVAKGPQSKHFISMIENQ